MSIVDLEKYKALIKAERQLFFAPPLRTCLPAIH